MQPSTRLKKRFNTEWKLFLERTKAVNQECKAAMQGMWRVRDKLSMDGQGLVLRGRRIVLPQSLWAKVVELAHQGHQGAAKTKARLRAKVWFPGMDSQVDELVGKCHSCIITSGEPRCCPVVTEPAIVKPWTKVRMDFGSFPDGRLTVVIIDSCTKFPVVDVVPSTAFENVRLVLQKTFAMFGLPDEVRTDNGPPFHGQEFRFYLEGLAIRHRKVWNKEKTVRNVYKNS
ncbi:hypothetical protein NDU88_010739 [Pleurodeles waltl]|uniref:Gypsy retrotransposon integrase-like protein 1 n=1 Tax=Pleurodeles waltl TaxID=8319 RepID=A0AAV7R1E7_PLEWA|nr:hypothetical protein NDU88_010739 [Pleurodeles waltl]